MQFETFTYEDCEKEPLKTIGHIQNFGALGNFDLLSRQFVSVSSNFAEWIGIQPHQLNSHLPESIQKRIEEFPKRVHANGSITRVISRINDISVPCDLSVSRQKDILVLELQKTDGATPERSAYESILNDLMIFERHSHFEDEMPWFDAIANAFRRLTEFPRILVYRFEADWSGTVVAEKLSSGTTDSYMGLRFPATDIPKIARDMFLLNPVRFIHDSRAPEVPIEVLRQSGNVELTDVDCRGVSPFHIRYLRNMKLATSMSFGIFHREKLWGLISCHSFEPRYADVVLRSYCVELARHVSNSLSIRHASRIMRLTDSIKGLLREKVSEQPSSLRLSLEALKDFIQTKTSACGFAVLVGEEVLTFGRTPFPGFFKSTGWLAHARSAISQTEHALSTYPGEQEYLNKCAGMIHAWYTFPGTTKKITLVLFREALPHIVNWAGKPPLKQTEALSPARSFELWQERLSDHSEPWTFNDQLFVRQLVTALGERYAT